MNFDDIRTVQVTESVSLDCVDGAGQAMTLPGELGYTSADPYAVTTTFQTAGGNVVWTFARDLLVRGLTAPAGDGDVHVWPCLDAAGDAGPERPPDEVRTLWLWLRVDGLGQRGLGVEHDALGRRVLVEASLDAEGQAVVIIELHSPDGELLVQVATKDVYRFVNRTLSAVPLGTEGEHLDLDVLIGQLMAA